MYTRGAGGTPAGVVITSEFSAVTTILNGALRINPFDVVNGAGVLDKALSMSKAEKEGRRMVSERASEREYEPTLN